MAQETDIRRSVAKGRCLLRRTELGQRARLQRLLQPLPVKMRAPGSLHAMYAVRQLMRFDPLEGLKTSPDGRLSDIESTSINPWAPGAKRAPGKKHRPRYNSAATQHGFRSHPPQAAGLSEKKRAQHGGVAPHPDADSGGIQKDAVRHTTKQGRKHSDSVSKTPGTERMTGEGGRPEVPGSPRAAGVPAAQPTDSRPDGKVPAQPWAMNPDEKGHGKSLAQRRKERIVSRERGSADAGVNRPAAGPGVLNKPDSFRHDTPAAPATKGIDSATAPSNARAPATGSDRNPGAVPAPPGGFAARRPAEEQQRAPRPTAEPPAEVEPVPSGQQQTQPAPPATMLREPDLAQLLAEAAYLHGIDRT